ncbi:hypothetical protein JCM5353_001284 [Sporobolomyces roseus]
MLLTGLISLNVVFTIAAAPLAGLVAFLVLYLITHPRLTRSPLHSKRPLTLTQHNTLLNRNENGGTGVWSRKWRRKVAVALAMGPTRRGLGDIEDEDEEDDQVGEGGEKLFERNWRVKVKPIPTDLKGCLKREGSFEVAKRKEDEKEITGRIGGEAAAESANATDEKVESSRQSPSPSPSISVSSSSSHSFYSPPLPSPSPPLLPVVPSTPIPARPRKTVSILEPSLVELEALRTMWDSPEMQSSVNGGFGLGGIAGYRRTRDYYARGQGGRGVNKTASSKTPSPAPPPATPKSTTPIPQVEKEKTTTTDQEEEMTTEEESPRLPSSSLSVNGTRRSAVPSLARQSSSSLSPSPASRRPLIKRALSPNASAGTGVGGINRGTSRAGSSRRGPSPSNAGSNRTASISPSPATERAQPRWVKTKKSTTSKTTIGSESTEDEELGGTGRNGTMSATVSDDDEDFEDVPPTPPSQPSLALAMAPLSSTSSSNTTTSSISPSLELLLDHTNRSLIRHDSQSRSRERPASQESPMSGSESLDDSPSPLPPSQTHLPTPSPSPSPIAKNSTPSFQITPASPDSVKVPLPPLPFSTSDSSVASSKSVSSQEGEDPNDPITSPTVEAKGGIFK